MKKLLLLLLIAPILGLGKNYLVRIDYDTSNAPISSTQIQNSYFTDDIVNVYASGSVNVDFDFPNELYPLQILLDISTMLILILMQYQLLAQVIIST